jgi:hypothetical protein
MKRIGNAGLSSLEPSPVRPDGAYLVAVKEGYYKYLEKQSSYNY